MLKQYETPQSNIEKHYRLRELCEVFGISATKVDRMVKSGELKKKKFGRTVFFAESDVLACFRYVD